MSVTSRVASVNGGAIAMVLSFALSSALACALFPAPARATAPGTPLNVTQIRQRTVAALGGGGFQLALDEDGLSPAQDGSLRVRRGASNHVAGSGASDVAGVVLWGLALFVLAAVIVAVFGQLSARRRAAAAAVAVATGVHISMADSGSREAVDTMPLALKSARRLAAQGQLEEAIHLLLRGAFDVVAILSALKLAPAMTAREVMGRARLDVGGSDALRHLVMSVEVSLFGGAAVSPEDFDRCAASFTALYGRLS